MDISEQTAELQAEMQDVESMLQPTHAQTEEETDLPLYEPSIQEVRVYTEAFANEALHDITTGKIGFDTEFVKRVIPDAEEQAVAQVGKTRRAAARAAYQRATAAAHIIDWSQVGVCVIQIAQGGVTHQHIQSTVIPHELRRILEAKDISKHGVNVRMDAKVIWEDFRINVASLVDVGYMAKIANPEAYAETAYTELSLLHCLQDFMGVKLNKDPQEGTDWSGQLGDADIHYAALDAQAGLEMVQLLDPIIQAKSRDLKAPIPADWYSFHYTGGKPFRLMKSIRDESLPWSPSVCPWWLFGRFQNYYV
ncbi:hypothetical protein C8R46DRAFT_1221457 [Mycena filopes]|nr:hypothetical protein C8R46DRAFT_1221457 [Mycena filopes]